MRAHRQLSTTQDSHFSSCNRQTLAKASHSALAAGLLALVYVCVCNCAHGEDLYSFLVNYQKSALDDPPSGEAIGDASPTDEPFGGEPIAEEAYQEIPITEECYQDIPFGEPLADAGIYDDDFIDSDSVNIETDTAVQPASYDYMSCLQCDPCSPGIGYSGMRTMNYLTGPYVKGGLTGTMGDGLFDGNIRPSYAISIGGRQPLGVGLGGRRLFFDVGGSYMSALGETTRNVRGKQTDTTTSAVTFVDDAFSITLEEVRRTGVHCGLGWYFGDLLDRPSNDPQMRLGFIFGGRFANMHGVSHQTQLVTPPSGSTLRSLGKTTDMTGGLYIDVEALLLRRSSPIGDCQWTLDGEFAHDWVNFEGFERRGLATASLLFGFMVAR